jgi:hypothetical protein
MSAYTPKPAFGHQEKRRANVKLLILAAAVSALLIGGGALVVNRRSETPNALPKTTQVNSVNQSQSRIAVSDRDLDVEATEAARAALKRGEIPPSLANVPEQARNEFLSGERSFYRTPLAVQQREDDTAAVRIFVDGATFQDVILSHVPAYFSLPLKRGVPATVTYLVTADRGGKGVAFRVLSEIREFRTRTLRLGERVSETVVLQ